MVDETGLLKQIGKLIDAKLEPIKKDMVTKWDVKGFATKQDLETAITASEERTKKELKQAILDSQVDTIETLKAYIDTAYNMQYERFRIIEDALDLPHPDKN